MAAISYLNSERKSYGKNILFQALCLMFLLTWISFYFTARDVQDWWIENILVILFALGLILSQKRFTFSDTSLIFIFLFLLLHVYGARMAYTQNELGEFFKNKWHLTRNPYDRIVHFSFGFLMAYPFADFLHNKFAVAKKHVFILVTMAILCLATVFELIEWGVAACTDKITGETYVASQGDPWDAQKDIILALIGAILFAIFYRIKRGGRFVDLFLIRYTKFNQMKIHTIFLLIAILFFSCKKEIRFLECTNNCKTFLLQGRVYDGTTNLGFSNTELKLRWEYFRSNCFYCPGDKYDIYVGKTDANGNFNFNITVDTSRFLNYSLNLITPKKENFYNSFVSSLNDSNLNQVPINIVYYPSTTLTLKLIKIQNSTLKFINIFHEWRQLHGDKRLIYITDYAQSRPIAGGDTTINMSTVADLKTIVTVEKRFLDNSFLDIKDSIICKKNQNNILNMYY